jgi:hypothetical protein
VLLTHLADIFDVLSLAIVAVASFILHRRIQTNASLCLLVSSVLLFIYRLLLPIPLFFILESFLRPDYALFFHHRLVQSTLQFFVTTSFLLIVISAFRPNNSFKPTPLRGAA